MQFNLKVTNLIRQSQALSIYYDLFL